MILLTLPAGHVADNYSRKKIITLMTLVMATSSLGLALISFYQAPVFLMYVCLFLNGATRTFQTAASASFLPSLVDRKDLSRAVNWSATTFQLASIIGPAGRRRESFCWPGIARFPFTRSTCAASSCSAS